MNTGISYHAVLFQYGVVLLAALALVGPAVWRALTKPARRACPHCAEQILLEAKVCPLCQLAVRPVDVQANEEDASVRP